MHCLRPIHLKVLSKKLPNMHILCSCSILWSYAGWTIGILQVDGGNFGWFLYQCCSNFGMDIFFKNILCVYACASVSWHNLENLCASWSMNVIYLSRMDMVEGLWGVSVYLKFTVAWTRWHRHKNMVPHWQKRLAWHYED